MKVCTVLFLVSVLVLSGCGLTATGDAYRDVIATRARSAADQTARNAKDYLCIYARVGSIARLFPLLIDRQAYRIMCTDEPADVPLSVRPAIPDPPKELEVNAT